MKYFNSFNSLKLGPDGVHSKKFTEKLVNGKGKIVTVQNDNGVIHKKTQKIDLRRKRGRFSRFRFYKKIK
jgi:hypothetical protein